jgi:hypothetical protein
MLRRLIGATLLLALAAVLATGNLFAQDQKKAPAPKDSATFAVGEYTGTVKTTPASDRTFIVTLEDKKLVRVPGARGTGNIPIFAGFPNLNSSYNKLVSAQTKYVQAATKVNNAKNPKALASAQQGLNNAAVQLEQAAINFKSNAVSAGIINTAILNNATARSLRNVRIQVTKTDVEFQTKDPVTVRTMVLPEQFDEKGNPKKYTKQELAELKGKDKSAPGYESALEKLEAGQTVKVFLTELPVKKKADDKEKDAAVKDPEKKMQVKTIHILSEADPDKGKKKPN